MNIAKNAGGIAQLALVGGIAYVGYRLVAGLGSLPSVTSTANSAWWQSSFGDLTLGAMDSYGDYLDWYDERGGTLGGYYNKNPDAIDSTGQTTQGSGSYWGGLAP